VAAAGLDPGRVIKCFVETPNVSASELRKLLGAGESVAGKVPAAVERYITSKHLYGDNRSVGT
jgi:nicotinic acid mononucleotide adenylyltransferase